jgi:phosphatidate phosphatase APP1
MVELYREVVDACPDAFVVYLSTGAWHTAVGLRGFLEGHGYPLGPLLLTHWGPVPEGWFRSGREHKREGLRRLLEEFPRLQWLLVGDDGQHDPSVYQEVAQAQPGKVLAVVIRQLSVAQQVVASGSPVPRDARVRSRGSLPGDLCSLQTVSVCWGNSAHAASCRTVDWSSGLLEQDGQYMDSRMIDNLVLQFDREAGGAVPVGTL